MLRRRHEVHHNVSRRNVAVQSTRRERHVSDDGAERGNAGSTAVGDGRHVTGTVALEREAAEAFALQEHPMFRDVS